MTEDSNNAVSNSFLLDDDSRLVQNLVLLMPTGLVLVRWRFSNLFF